MLTPQQTSPTLTSTSDTLDAVPISKMAAAVGGSTSCTADGAAALLLASLQSSQRHAYIRPALTMTEAALSVVKDTLEGFAADVGAQQEQRLKESRKRKRRGGGGGGGDDAGEEAVLKLRKVHVEGFETAQVWQQTKRIIAGVLGFCDGVLGELEAGGEIAAVTGDEVAGAGDEEIDGGVNSEDDDDDDDDDDDFEDEELLEEASDEDGQDEMDISAVNGHDDSTGVLVEEEEEEDDEDQDEEDEDEAEFVEDAHGLNDGFFSIDDFNRQTQLYEEQDARGDGPADADDEEDIDWGADPFAPSKSAQKSGRADDDHDDKEEEEEEEEEDDGPTFGDMALDAPEGDSEDEVMLNGEDGEDGEQNANDIYYKDFFAPPPSKKMHGGKTRAKPKKSVQFDMAAPPAEADMERAMANVRRDLFDDDDSEAENGAGSDSDAGASDLSAGDPRSRRSAHERRQAKLIEEMRKLEAASVAKREWTLSGEAAAADRPLNSLLEEDLDFEQAGKPVAPVTPEVSEDIEALIKRRILAQEFDEVRRRRPDVDAGTGGVPTRRGLAPVDDAKSSKGLAELYAEDQMRDVNNNNKTGASSTGDEKLAREEAEVAALWRDVCSHLDALSSWHYKPKPVEASLAVVADVAAVSMEDAQPGTSALGAGVASRLAPQEVYRAGDGARAAAAAAAAASGDGEAGQVRSEVSTRGGLPVSRAEMTREEKMRRRRRTKERARKGDASNTNTNKNDNSNAAKINTISKGSGQKKGNSNSNSNSKSGKANTIVADLRRGGVRVINRRGEVTDVDGNVARVRKSLTGGGLKL